MHHALSKHTSCRTLATIAMSVRVVGAEKTREEDSLRRNTSAFGGGHDYHGGGYYQGGDYNFDGYNEEVSMLLAILFWVCLVCALYRCCRRVLCCLSCLGSPFGVDDPARGDTVNTALLKKTPTKKTSTKKASLLSPASSTDTYTGSSASGSGDEGSPLYQAYQSPVSGGNSVNSPAGYQDRAW